MQKLIISCSIAVCSIVAAATAFTTTVEAQTPEQTPVGFLDNTSLQVIEKINGNIVTFKNDAGESNNSYVPTWMFSKFNLQVVTSVNLFNSDMAQTTYPDRNIKEVSPILKKVDTSAVNKPRSECILSPILNFAICPGRVVAESSEAFKEDLNYSYTEASSESFR